MTAYIKLNPGEVIGGKYEIVSPIGEGGSGTVYRAKKVGMKLMVALKVMHAEHPDSVTERQRFAREAEVIRKLQHPNILRLTDYGHTDDGVPFLVFALLEGQSLESKIRNDGALSLADTGKFSLHVLRALDKAHSMDVVHRDIKPGNIFLTTGVLGEVAQVLDFGLAKVVGAATADMDVTRVGSVLGTPRYMAPEQARGEAVGQAADIYSFGLVMAEMVLGRPMVDAKQDMDFYVTHGSDRALPLPKAITDSPFGGIIQRAVAKKVSVRYRQASQMLADVKAVVEQLEGGAMVEPAAADMDATVLLDPTKALRGDSTSNPTAEKLRKAFNVIADKQAPPPAPAPPPQAGPATPSPGAAGASATPGPPEAAAAASSQGEAEQASSAKSNEKEYEATSLLDMDEIMAKAPPPKLPAVAPSLTGPSAGDKWMLPPDPAGRETRLAAQKKSQKGLIIGLFLVFAVLAGVAIWAVLML